MKIGILSDTHGSLPASVVEGIRDCDLLVHAGDIASENCYRAIKQLHIPTYMIKGNCDRGSYAQFLPETLSFSIDGILVYLLHDKNKLPLMPSGTKLVIYGHTHHYRLYENKGITFLNPGSIGDGRGEARSYAIIETNTDGFTVTKRLVETD